MTVECTHCGRTVDVPTLPARCPACRHAITPYVPPLTFSPTTGHRVQPAGSPRRSTGRARNPDDTFTNEPLETLPEWNDEAEANAQYQRRRAERDTRWWKIAGAAVCGLLIAYVLIDYVLIKTRVKQTGSGTAVATTPAPAAPVRSRPAPGPAPAPGPTTPFSAAAAGATGGPAPAAVTTPDPAPAPPPAPVAAAPPPTPSRLTPVRTPPPADVVTDDAINAAIERGITYLLGQFATTGDLKPDAPAGGTPEGAQALAVLALLHAGQATFDQRLSLSGEFMTAAIDRMKKNPMKTTHQVYSRGIRASALAVHARQVDRAALQADLTWLLRAAVNGAYAYDAPRDDQPRESIRWDNSNTQYGNLGVWAAADAGLTVPATYWRDVEAHWTANQCEDGGWAYHGPSQGHLAMTAAGVNMLFVARDQLNADRAAGGGVAKEPYPPSILRGLEWLGKGNNAIHLASGYPGYTLYGIERAALASGYKYFGPHDWYRALGRDVLREQAKDGSWQGGHGAVVATSFRLLFLARGRHPILMNKLRFDGAWANRPRDLVKLSKFVFNSIERPVNWQVVSLDEDWHTWTDSPILYIASHAAAELSDADVAKLRGFAEAGGLLFTHADADSDEFNKFVEELAPRLFPEYPLASLPEDHPIYSSLYQPRTKPPLRGISNGSRLLLVHSPTELAATWQFRDPKLTTARPVFEMGANVYLYATGKHPPRNRLDMLEIPAPAQPPIATVKVARLKYDGPWDPEPWAWKRLGRWMGWETGIALEATPAQPIDLKSSAAPLAHLTGTTTAWSPGDEDVARIRDYVAGGGVLLVDPVGGAPDVGQALRKNVLDKAFPGAEWKPLEPEHPLRAGAFAGGEPLPKQKLRVYAVEHYDNRGPEMEILEHGKGAVIFSHLDVTSGLLGTTTWGVLGYDPTYATPFMKNLILWTINERNQPNTWFGPGTRPAAKG